jgi:glucose/arabinose dehydrogenase
MRRVRLALVLTLLVALPARADDEHPSPPPASIADHVKLLEVARAREPVGLVAVPDDARRRLLVVEKGGRLRVMENGVLAPGALLDVSDRVSRGSEQGLLGVAVKNGKIYIDMTDKKGDTRILEYPFTEPIDAARGREILFVKKPYPNHNGGNLVFGPDGKLYVGTGDGGAGYDPHKNGQNPSARLAKMLRITVEDGKIETFDIGLRNPWRYSFDRKTGDLWIADVGQDRWEEIDVQPAGAGPLNFGWSVMEARHCLRGASCDPTGPTGSIGGWKEMTAPILEYSHKTGCSITGGGVYRGRALPELDGAYFYSDYCTAILRSLRWRDGRVSDSWDWKRALDPDFRLAQVSAFGEDHDGELYLLSLEGPIYKLVRR